VRNGNLPLPADCIKDRNSAQLIVNRPSQDEWLARAALNG
jgi:hypothetical protein